MLDVNDTSIAARLIAAQKDLDADLTFDAAQDQNRCGENRCGENRCGENRCGGCHRRCFCVSETEFALILGDILTGWDSGRVGHIVELAKEQRALITAKYRALSEKLDGVLTLNELMNMDRITLPFSCVFLDEAEQRCTIYKYRPLICRIYGLGCIPEDRGTTPCDDRSLRTAELDRFNYINAYTEKLLSFLFLENPGGGCPVIRRPAPLFYFFSLVFSRAHSDKPPDIAFGSDLLYLSEHDYIRKLLESAND